MSSSRAVATAADAARATASRRTALVPPRAPPFPLHYTALLLPLARWDDDGSGAISPAEFALDQQLAPSSKLQKFIPSYALSEARRATHKQK